jgi:hypothetical protein
MEMVKERYDHFDELWVYYKAATQNAKIYYLIEKYEN